MKCWVVLVYVEQPISGNPSYENIGAYTDETVANDTAVALAATGHITSLHEMTEVIPCNHVWVTTSGYSSIRVFCAHCDLTKETYPRMDQHL